MTASSNGRSFVLERLLRGIEAGIVGGLAMLILLVAASRLNRHVWWEVPNLLGSTFYGMRALYYGAGRATVAGVALHLMISGLIGSIFGIIFGNLKSRRRLLLLGIAVGVGWYYIANALLWPRVNPLIPLYWPTQATVLPHALFGICLGYIGTNRGQAFPQEDSVANRFTDAVES